MISPFLVFSGLCLLISAADIVGYLSISLYLHPYAKYPGPLAAKLTDWYAVYHTYIGDLHTDVWEFQCPQVEGGSCQYKYYRQHKTQGVPTTPKPRVLCCERSVDGRETEDDCSITDLFKEHVGLTLHPGDYFTFDVMSELVFGTSYDLLNDAQNHFIIDGIVAHMQRFGFLLHFPGLEKIKMNYILFPHARRKAMRFYGRVESKNDVFSQLLTAKDPETGESFSNQQLRVESNLLIIAGRLGHVFNRHGCVIFYLSRNPAAYARVTKEIRMILQASEEVCQGPKLSSCVYLRACIQEAIRLCPPVTGPLWGEVLPGGIVIPEHNISIPAGCEVGTGFCRLELYPERWISEEGGAAQVGLANAVFASFSVGPRNCVGKGLAYDFRRAETTRLGNVGEGKGASKGQFGYSWDSQV
ncbi:cytochrome P450 [Lipomyces tetrasporus]|uniref:Cytochrome P450 n=1 Tax=Lipomyces tetrasporus TaxID=54092 RepID=A0AAD7VQY9_9ASCO|nr:cytochrome P450 [Lipomyces tetrasporus]KAJ8097660.1 cytochrome P450 [Lipomyces tetrasporus]